MNIRILKDKIAGRTMLVFTLVSVLLAILVAAGLLYRSWPLIEKYSIWDLLSSSAWKPEAGEFGFLGFIMGTLWVTALAIVIAFPLCLMVSIYLSEYAHPRLRSFMMPIIDLLSGIPPVLFGVWGVLFIVPLIQDHIAPHFVQNSSGYSVLAGGIVLAIMIFPLLISLFLEVFSSVPRDMSNASLSLGASQWQTVKYVLLKKSTAGIIAAVVLAVSRAFGETIAVLMVCGGNVPGIPHSVFDSAYPLPVLIANNFGETFSVPLYDSALLFAALVLFVIIFVFNAISRIVLARVKKRME